MSFQICLWIVAVLVLVDPSKVSAQTMPTAEQQLAHDVSAAKALISSKNFEEISRLIVGIQDSRAAGNDRYSIELVLEISRALPRQAGNATFYAMRECIAASLDNVKGISIEERVELLLELRRCSIALPTTGKDFPARRREDASMLLRGWKELVQDIDPGWDPKDYPLTNVPLPYGVLGVNSVNPTEIDDSVIQAQYEDAVRKNKEKAVRYRAQHFQRHLQSVYCPVVEQFIATAYGLGPEAEDELRGLLAANVTDKAASDRMLAALAAKRRGTETATTKKAGV